MKGLSRDFIHNDRVLMIVEKQGGMASSDLSQVQVNMIMHNEIPGHLRMQIRDIDGTITFSYDITGRKMLSHLVKSERVTLSAFYHLLLQITHTLIDSRLYMLDERQFLLHEDYMFMEGELEEGKIKICYVPFQAQPDQEKVSEQLYQLIVRLMPYVTELKGNGLQNVLQLCAADHFSLSALNELLLELMTEHSLGGTSQVHDMRNLQSFQAADHYSARASISSVRQASGYQGQGSEASRLESTHGSHTRSAKGQAPQAQSLREIRPMSHTIVSHQGNSQSEHLNALFQHTDHAFALPKQSHDPQDHAFEQREKMQAHKSASSNEQDMRLPLDGSLAAGGSIFAAFDTPAYEEKDNDPFSISDVDEVKKPVNPMYYWLGCLLASSVVWRFIYMDRPTSTGLILCTLITIVFILLAYLFAKGIRLPFTVKSSEVDTGDPSSTRSASKDWFAVKKKGDSREWWRWNKGGSLVADAGLGPVNALANEPALFETSKDTIHSQFNVHQTAMDHLNVAVEEASEGSDTSYYDSLKHNTQILSAAKVQATVLLSEMGQEAAGSSTSNESIAYLERCSPEGNVDTIPVGRGSFIIGRSNDVASYVEAGTGASRAHVEISRSDSGYVLKDLNSVNGTLFQDEAMVPYKEYILQDGDSFVIARAKYTFHLRMSHHKNSS
ncbi:MULTISPECIES: DUF6382 domain-containing protein [unclassified Paenibacillus]|uniref:DUF6382 domain-containing protein n=1 Tax=unclassified Paenibacillus TaxID=185978 RepID=UPI000899C052|nr:MULTISPECIES: DUF6382 domain-containing protein [unclassified Paenibacillus]OMC71843.1 hypothetical protein BK126_07300 [Paenibacillus sp. FSL H7-0326]SDW39810.1 FHA domain-containing protein [Paenibacillus sp. PDC88]